MATGLRGLCRQPPPGRTQALEQIESREACWAPARLTRLGSRWAGTGNCLRRQASYARLPTDLPHDMLASQTPQHVIPAYSIHCDTELAGPRPRVPRLGRRWASDGLGNWALRPPSSSHAYAPQQPRRRTCWDLPASPASIPFQTGGLAGHRPCDTRRSRSWASSGLGNWALGPPSPSPAHAPRKPRRMTFRALSRKPRSKNAGQGLRLATWPWGLRRQAPHVPHNNPAAMTGCAWPRKPRATSFHFHYIPK